MEQAARNARESLARRMAESASQAALLDGIAEAFGLDGAPERIEVYDNSHIMGTNAVGAMIVAGPEGFVKGQYRKFNIKGDGAPGDDFAMMREVLTRRFGRLAKEDPDRQSDAWPDLVLIDGGPGQVAAACAALQELGIDEVPVVGVAKGVDRDAGKEEFHRPGKPPMALGHATRCSISCSGCATRRTASRSGRTGPSGRRRRGRRRSTRCRGWARRGNGRCSRTSGRPRR